MPFKMKYETKHDLLPLVKSGRRTGSRLQKVKFIVAHDVGNDGKDKHGRKNGTTARGNISYYKNTPTIQASAHVFIDDKEILICVPLLEKAWHVLYNVTKDNQLFGANANDAAIGVELCYYPEDKKRSLEAYKRYVWYLAYLCYQYKLNPLTQIVGHHILDSGRKSDPVNALKYIGKSYQDLLHDVEIELLECSQEVKGVSKKSKVSPEAEFSSPTVRETYEKLLVSKATQQMIIDNGIAAGAFGEAWRTKWEKRELAPMDIVGLAVLKALKE